MRKVKRFLLCLNLMLTGTWMIFGTSAGAMTFKAGEMGEMEVSGKITASFGATEYLDFVDDNDKGDDSDFDATRELSLKTLWRINDHLKGVASFQIGEGSVGGYFGSTDAEVGGEESGDVSFELDELYIDYTTSFGLNMKMGSQSFDLGEISYGSHLMSETPAGAVFSMPISPESSVQAGWFRMADLMDDSTNNTGDQADLLFTKFPLGMGNSVFTPWAAYAHIQSDVIKNAPYQRYAFFDYPTLLTGTNGIGNTDPTDDVTAYYAGITTGFSPYDALTVKGSATYGSMDWETTSKDITIAGFFADVVVNYKMQRFTPEVFAFYGEGPDANDDDISMMPVLIGGPSYTSSYFGGSRFNDNMFDSYDATYAVSMWAVGFKLKDIRTGKNLTHEFQIMYAGGTADDSIFQSPDDILLNEDESVLEINFNSEYQIMKNLVFATELGYMLFDEDADYDEAAGGSVEDFWKVAFAFELKF